jgi:hypothetical protein
VFAYSTRWLGRLLAREHYRFGSDRSASKETKSDERPFYPDRVEISVERLGDGRLKRI